MMLTLSPLSPLLDALAADVAIRRGLCRTKPSVTAREADDHFLIMLPVPGVAPTDIKIEALDSRIVVRGSSSYRTIDTSFALPEKACVAEAVAESIDGLLTIRVPKQPASPPTSIAVSTELDDDTRPDDDTSPRPYHITLVAPGLSAADIDLQVDECMLKVSGGTASTGASIARCIRLPRDANVEAVRASHVDGILSVTVPKKPPPAPTHIEVKGVPTIASVVPAPREEADEECNSQEECSEKMASSKAAEDQDAMTAGEGVSTTMDDELGEWEMTEADQV